MNPTGVEHSKLDLISAIILSSFFVFVPMLRCKGFFGWSFEWFFDSYLIKFWVVQVGVAIVFILFCYRPPLIQLNSAVKILLLAYLGINILSWLTVPSPHRYVALPTLVAIITYILMCFLVSQYLINPERVVALWILVTVGVALLGICQYYYGVRVISTLGNENFLASHMALTVPVTIGYFWRYLKNLPPHQKLKEFWRGGKTHIAKQILMLGTGIAVLLAFGTVLYCTHSRGAWFGLSAGLVSFVIIAGVPSGKRMLASLIIILVILAFAIMPGNAEFIIRQFEGDVRPPIWKSSIYMIAMRPWLGWGKGAYFIFYPRFRVIDYWLARTPTDLTVHAHNEFLQIWSETGIIGLVIFLALIIAILRVGIQKINKWRDYSQRYLIIGMVSGVICLLTHNLVCNNLQIHSSAIFLWLVLGLILGMGPPSPRSPTLQRPTPPVFWRVRPLILLALIGIMTIIIWWICIKPLVSQYIFKQGLNYRLKDNWGQAIERYKKAITWDPWNVEMHYRMAYAYGQTGQLDKAIEKYNDVCRLAPEYGNVYRNMGIVYMEKGEHRLAAQCFLKARQINPYDLGTLQNLNVLRVLHDK